MHSGLFRAIVDLKPYKGGIMRGTFWVNELTAAGIRYEEITKQEQNIKMLAADRVGFVCMPKEIAIYLIKKLGKDPHQYAFGRLRADGQPVGIFLKTKFKELREDVDQGLALIKQDGLK
nr:transporter substrate-binding domain-containing protein [uncultured Desulfobacter sp.]